VFVGVSPYFLVSVFMIAPYLLPVSDTLPRNEWGVVVNPYGIHISDSSRQEVSLRFIRVDGWWFGDVDYRLRVTGNRLSPIKYDIPKYESLQRFIEVCADSLGYTLSQNPRSSFLRKVLPMIRKLSTMTEKEIMQYAEQELPL
jgi:hypothetical protein